MIIIYKNYEDILKDYKFKNIVKFDGDLIVGKRFRKKLLTGLFLDITFFETSQSIAIDLITANGSKDICLYCEFIGKMGVRKLKKLIQKFIDISYILGDRN